ncbi:unnamed protein product, partial [Mesorhabditis belari]|uniref:Uncharacterized protein n=1 Tax=Mesorhabditis belari TaxID=2138241 RepID=A0AAF3FM34_9BILA
MPKRTSCLWETVDRSYSVACTMPRLYTLGEDCKHGEVSPAKFRGNSGCGSIFHHYDKVDHEETCEFRRGYCLLTTDINLLDGVDWVMMQSCFGYHFMLVLGKRENKIADDKMRNRVAGTPKSTSRSNFRPRRKERVSF